MTIVPDRGSAFVLLVNSDRFQPAIGELTRAALSRLLGFSVESPRAGGDFRETRLDDYVGRYDSVEVERVGDEVVLSGGESMRVRFSGPDEGLGDGRALIRFLRENGVVTWMRIDGEVLGKHSR